MLLWNQFETLYLCQIWDFKYGVTDPKSNDFIQFFERKYVITHVMYTEIYIALVTIFEVRFS